MGDGRRPFADGPVVWVCEALVINPRHAVACIGLTDDGRIRWVYSHGWVRVAIRRGLTPARPSFGPRVLAKTLMADVFSGFCSAGFCWPSLIAILAIGYGLLRRWVSPSGGMSVGQSIRLAANSIRLAASSVRRAFVPGAMLALPSGQADRESTRDLPVVQRWLARSVGRRLASPSDDDPRIVRCPVGAQNPPSGTPRR